MRIFCADFWCGSLASYFGGSRTAIFWTRPRFRRGREACALLIISWLQAMHRAGLEQNAVTYGIYHRAVLDAEWPTQARQNAVNLWTRLRLFHIYCLKKYLNSFFFADWWSMEQPCWEDCRMRDRSARANSPTRIRCLALRTRSSTSTSPRTRTQSVTLAMRATNSRTLRSWSCSRRTMSSRPMNWTANRRWELEDMLYYSLLLHIVLQKKDAKNVKWWIMKRDS